MTILITMSKQVLAETSNRAGGNSVQGTINHNGNEAKVLVPNSTLFNGVDVALDKAFKIALSGSANEAVTVNGAGSLSAGLKTHLADKYVQDKIASVTFA